MADVATKVLVFAGWMWPMQAEWCHTTCTRNGLFRLKLNWWWCMSCRLRFEIWNVPAYLYLQCKANRIYLWLCYISYVWSDSILYIVHTCIRDSTVRHINWKSAIIKRIITVAGRWTCIFGHDDAYTYQVSISIWLTVSFVVHPAKWLRINLALPSLRHTHTHIAHGLAH